MRWNYKYEQGTRIHKKIIKQTFKKVQITFLEIKVVIMKLYTQ